MTSVPGSAPDAARPGFTELVFSDCERFEPGKRPSWLLVLRLLPFHPGLLATLFLRAQQSLAHAGRHKLALGLRTVGSILTGADFIPGADVGRRLLIGHPVGVTIGTGSRLGDDVTLSGGVVLGVRNYGGRQADGDLEGHAVVGDRVFIGAHAVLLGGITVGDDAYIGANSVVARDVPAGTVVMGVPARPVGQTAATEPAG